MPKSTASVYEYPTPPVCVDLDGDGTMEIIFASWTDCEDGDEIDGPYGRLGTGTGVNGALYVLNSRGELLASMDLHIGYRGYGDRDNRSVGYTNGVMAAPEVVDIDGDGKYEVLLNTTYYALCAYEISLGSSGAEFSGSFNDVPEGEWYTAPVNWAAENGIALGRPGNIFDHGATCTKAEIITFLWRAAGRPGSTSFDKMPAGVNIDPAQYYAVPVYWAATHSVVVGLTDTTFGPGETCTRGQIATFLYRAYVEPYTP